MFTGLSLWQRQRIAIVHLIHLMNTEQCQAAAKLWTSPIVLGRWAGLPKQSDIQRPTFLLTKKSRTFPRLSQDPHEKFSWTFLEPTNA